MQKTLHDHHTSISIGVRPMCNLRFADIYLMGGSNDGLQDQQTHRQSNSIWNGSQHRKEQDHNQQHEQHQCRSGLDSQKLEEVTSFKYLGATLCKDCTCSADVCIRIASAMAAVDRLSWIWWCNTISFASKFELYKSLRTSIVLYSCETWTLL